MIENKFRLMNIALEIFKIEIQKGNVSADFNNIYTTLKYEILGEGVINKLKKKIEDHNSKPTAEEYFKNRDLGVDSKSPEPRDMDKIDLESYNIRIR